MEKYELIPEQLLYEGTITKEQFFHPDALTREELLLTHTAAYLDKLDVVDLTRREQRDIGFPVRKDLVERGKKISKGTLMCAEFAATDGVAMNIAGGTHHAYSDHGEGFCVFNDFAIASNLLLAKGMYNRILIIDLDVHQGNGTAAIFRKNKSVFTLSVHGERNYPLRKEKSDLDIGLPDKADDHLYLRTLEKHLPKTIEDFKPEFIFYLAGVDILETDKLGRLSVSKEGCKQRDEYVFMLCKQYNIPVAVSMGGGYSPKLSDIIDAHANTYRAAMDIYF
jgi:acetoin utilization deacetylase AcuC-like enzyme